MRTHGHREGSTKHWGLLGGKGEGQLEGEVGRDSLRRNAKWVKGRRVEKHTAMCVPLQLSCMLCSCTPKCNSYLKVSLFEIDPRWPTTNSSGL